MEETQNQVTGKPETTEEARKHRIFLEEFIVSGDVDHAATVSGVSKVKRNQLITRYRNEYKAIFEQLEMSDRHLIKELVEVIKAPTKAVYNAGTKMYEEYDDLQLKLNAIKLAADILGMINKESVVIHNTVINSEAEQIKYRQIKADPATYKKMQEIFLGQEIKPNEEAVIV